MQSVQRLTSLRILHLIVMGGIPFQDSTVSHPVVFHSFDLWLYPQQLYKAANDGWQAKHLIFFGGGGCGVCGGGGGGDDGGVQKITGTFNIVLFYLHAPVLINW